MTVGVEVPSALAPVVVAACARLLRPAMTCPGCYRVTTDVPEDRRRPGFPAWPCRPCRRISQKARDAKRAKILRSVARCPSQAVHGKRTCRAHRPRFM